MASRPNTHDELLKDFNITVEWPAAHCHGPGISKENSYR